MGDQDKKKDQQKNLLELMEDSITNLNKNLAYLTQRLNEEKNIQKQNPAAENAEDIIRLEKAMAMMEQQIGMAKQEKKDMEITLAKLEQEEEKRKMENVLKGAIFFGAINERNRIAMENERNIAMQVNRSYEEEFEAAKDKAFAEGFYKFINPDMAEEIVNNQEFIYMAENDPNRIKHEVEELEADFEVEMERRLSYANVDYDGDDFEEKEKKDIEELKEENGFESATRQLKDFVVDEFSDVDYSAETKFLMDTLKEVEKLAKETRHLQDDFISGKSSFKTGNGFTDDIIERELKVKNSLKEYIDNITKRANQLANAGGDEKKIMDLIKLSGVAQKIIFPITKQYERDLKYNKTRNARMKEEMWDLFQKLPKQRSLTMKKAKSAEEEKNRAWAKIRRMGKVSQERGGIYADVSKIAEEGAIILLERCTDPAEMTDKDRKMLREKMAAVVLNQMIINEANIKDYEDRPIHKKLHGSKEFAQKTFRALAKEMAETPEFKKLTDPILKGKNNKRQAIRFLANDMERKMARDVVKKQAQAEIKK